MSGNVSGELSFEMDDREGIVRVRGTGLWTAEQATIHFIDLHRAITGLRAVRKPVLVLVDLSKAAVQIAEVAEAVSAGTGRIYREADYVALVAGTALLAMQMKRAANVPNFAVFNDMDMALAWLRERRVALGG